MKNRSKTIALAGILCAQAIALSFVENLLPPIPGFPPGAKPGFSNIVVMFAATQLPVPYAILIVAAKALFAGFTRGITAFAMSLAGGCCSLLLFFLLSRPKQQLFSPVGIGICGGVSHNIGQLLVAVFLVGGKAFLAYLPVLLLFGIITGSVTGYLLKLILPILNKQKQYFI